MGKKTQKKGRDAAFGDDPEPEDPVGAELPAEQPSAAQKPAPKKGKVAHVLELLTLQRARRLQHTSALLEPRQNLSCSQPCTWPIQTELCLAG